ncbi:MAG TPA: hypothetical protein VK066_03870 [Chloroflexota bacterium]|nr:hypothetical protein [Chloroflexota bacterium]
MSLDDLSRADSWKRIREWLGSGNDASPGPWESAIRLGCQALVQAPRELRSVRLEGFAGRDIPYGTRMLHFVDRAEAIAAEFGLRAQVDYHGGCPGVTLLRRST